MRNVNTKKIFSKTNLLKRAATLAIVSATISAAPVVISQQAWAANAPIFAEGRILVQPLNGVTDADLSLELNRHGAQAMSKIDRTRVHIVRVPAQAEEAIVNALKHNPKIEFAELDRLISIDQTVNDPSFSNQWHLSKINAPTAWDSATGSNVIVAVLDTGVNIDHPDLQGQLLTGWNAVDQGTDYSDIQGHGTLVSGTIAATTNNSTGVASVAWGVKILPIRVSNATNGYAYFSDIARGLTWAADQGARVANISYDATASSAITSAAQYMVGKGGLVVTSAGNSGTDLGYSDNIHMISVSATDSNDNITSWSSFGNYIDVTAPGASILTTNSGGSYSYVSGTSFSSPITAGVVALIMSANNALTPAEVETVLKQSAKDVNNNGWDNKYGHGRVDAAAAVALALNINGNPVVPDDVAPTVAITSPSDGATIKGTAKFTVNANDNVGVTNLQAFIDNRLLTSVSNTSTLNFSLNTRKYTVGVHTVSVQAVDAAGNMGTTSITVNVTR